MHILVWVHEKWSGDQDMDERRLHLLTWDEEGDRVRLPKPTLPHAASQSHQWHAQTQPWARAKLNTDLLSHG